MLATGHFHNDTEANSVLDEMIALKYTAAQLRFAFLLLLEQEVPTDVDTCCCTFATRRDG